jgi:hypothetical protein
MGRTSWVNSSDSSGLLFVYSLFSSSSLLPIEEEDKKRGKTKGRPLESVDLLVAGGQ